MTFFPLRNIKEDILEECWEPNSFGSYWVSLNSVWLPTSFKISSFMFRRRKKCIQVWNIMNNNFYFWIDYPFKINKKVGGHCCGQLLWLDYYYHSIINIRDAGVWWCILMKVFGWWENLLIKGGQAKQKEGGAKIKGRGQTYPCTLQDPLHPASLYHPVRCNQIL